ncbi:putative nucleotidyltransferase [Myroides gitamensis]|nr:putative nucleotidyltransferase [Myroides gitamensis]
MTIDEMKAQELVLFECISGSRAYGLATKDSDTDIRGVFYLPKEQFYGLNYIPQISNETNDIVYYELGRFIELLRKNNPNILELLATPEEFVLFKHPIFDKIRLEDFLSKLTKEAFAGYAMSQVKKAKGLNKKVFHPMDKQRKELLDFLLCSRWRENCRAKKMVASE